MEAELRPGYRARNHVFVSYRSSRRDLALRISGAVRAAGLTSDTLEADLDCPFPRGSAAEFKWLTDRIAPRIAPGTTFVMMASDDAGESHWVLWEGVEGFLKADRVIICWLSGSDPLKTVFPLPRLAYRVVFSPQSFIVDARGDPETAVEAVARIVRPSRRYRVLLRVQQAVTTLLCMAMVLFPVTVLLATGPLPEAASHAARSALLRPWVCLLALWAGLLVAAAFYPSYGGPLRIAPQPVDAHIRLVTPGFTGWRWKTSLFAGALLLAFAIDGIHIASLRSMSAIGWSTYLKAGIIAVLLGLGYERIRFNLLTVHLGTIYRKLEKQFAAAIRSSQGP